MSSRHVTAPAAPGAMGQDIDAGALLAYLDELGRWVEARKAELDELDQAALRAAGRDSGGSGGSGALSTQSLTGDIVLSMTLWQSISQRYDAIVAVWDSGRVAEAERRRIATLIWGRLDDGQAGTAGAGGGVLSVSLPEACRLSDTLAASLRSALGLGGADPGEAARVYALRETVERIRDQVQLIPAKNRGSAQTALIDLDRRVVDVTDRFKRGADVGGLLGPLESALALTERDLIVAASQRATTKLHHARAVELRERLIERAEEVRAVAARAQAEVRPVPRLGIPDPAALGEVPTREGLEEYLARLERVEQALEQAHNAYAEALARREDTVGLARSYGAQADTFPGVPGAADDIEALLALVDAADAAAPADTDRLAALAAAVQAYTTELRGRDRR